MTERYIEWKHWNADDFGRFRKDEALYYTEELKASGISTVAGLTIGELGFGNGAFAGWARNAGGNWLGRETLAELCERATQTGFAVISSESGFADDRRTGTFDLVVAFDVIEHLELPAIRSFLTDARDVLRPGGLVLLRLPSGDSPFSLAIYHGDVTHRTLLGSSAIRQLAAEVGLEVRQIRPPVLPTSGFAFVRGVRRLLLLAVRAVSFKFIGTILMGNAGAILTPNMIVVLRRAEAA